VTREGHARFWERPEVKFLRATRQSLPIDLARTTSAHPPTAEVSLRCGKCRNGPMKDIRFSLDDLVGYSITLSARASNVSGTITPSAFAVLRLITSSNRVGCSTGMLATLMPWKSWMSCLARMSRAS
jgi:hypothetical protein